MRGCYRRAVFLGGDADVTTKKESSSGAEEVLAMSSFQVPRLDRTDVHGLCIFAAREHPIVRLDRGPRRRGWRGVICLSRRLQVGDGDAILRKELERLEEENYHRQVCSRAGCRVAFKSSKLFLPTAHAHVVAKCGERWAQ